MDVEDNMLEQARTAAWSQQGEKYYLQVEDLLEYEGTAYGYDGGGSFSAVVRYGCRDYRGATPGWLFDVEHDVCAGDERQEEEPLATLEEAQEKARDALVDHIEDWCEATYVNVVSSYGKRDQDEEA
ncbi:hypothetical protein AAII07_31910 [Microvirga sp. 0TCS3.31]